MICNLLIARRIFNVYSFSGFIGVQKLYLLYIVVGGFIYLLIISLLVLFQFGLLCSFCCVFSSRLDFLYSRARDELLLSSIAGPVGQTTDMG